jgi:DNA repair exonuclease SbcCD ATPase subunit
MDALKQNNDELVMQKRGQVDALSTEIDFTNSAIVKLQAEITQLQSTIDDQGKVRSRLEKILEISRQVDSKLDRIKKESEFFSSHSDCPTCRQGIDDGHKAEILKKGNTQISEIQSGKQKILEELDSINSRLTEISSISSTISTKNAEVSEYNIENRTKALFIEEIEKEITKLQISNKQIDENSTELTDTKKVLRDYITGKENLISEKQVLDIANTLLKDSGIKTKIIKQYVPIMNKLINKYLASMDFFVNFELNEAFEETIKSRFRDDFSYESFSEGEKSRIDLALLFTWRAVAKLRNSASTNLLILDEVFDSSMDVQGSDELMKILQTLAGDTNVFVISHKTDQLVDKFANVIRFEKHKNFSRMIS